MSRQTSLKELFTNSQSLPEVENYDDLGELVPEREENDDLDSLPDPEPGHVSPAVMSDQDSPSSELEDEATTATTGTETEGEIISPISHIVESSLQKNLVNSSVVLILNGLIMINGHLGFIGMTVHKKHFAIFVRISLKCIS